MEGYINENLEPRIVDVYLIGKKENIALEPILDTGFNDQFSLPNKYKEDCDLPFLGVETYMLADDSKVEERVYLGQIIIDNQPRFVERTLTDDEDALIGMRLIRNKIAIFDLKNNSVKVEN